MPEFGSPDTPANSGEVPGRYIEKGQEETGAVNIVTGMILDYRAFDTLGESHVLFIAACTVLILVRIDHRKDGSLVHKELAAEEDDRKLEPKNDKILQKSAFILVPVIILFGIYVILNGHISPGGGFSGGAIIGAGLILYLNAFGFKKTAFLPTGHFPPYHFLRCFFIRWQNAIRFSAVQTIWRVVSLSGMRAIL